MCEQEKGVFNDQSVIKAEKDPLAAMTGACSCVCVCVFVCVQGPRRTPSPP